MGSGWIEPLARIPAFDKTKKANAFNQNRLRKQASGQRKGVLYFSDYWGMRKVLLRSKPLNRVLRAKAEMVSQALQYNIGTSDDHPGRYHLKDTIRVRRRVPSGAKHDRQTYEIYSTVPERFIPAVTQLEKRRLAITKAIQSAGTRG